MFSPLANVLKLKNRLVTTGLSRRELLFFFNNVKALSCSSFHSCIVNANSYFCSMNRKLKNSELERKTVAEFKSSRKSPVVVVLDNIRSLNNIGSVFRTADAFLIEAIYLCGICAQPPHKDISKTALGATESVAWKYFKTTAEAVAELKEQAYTVISVEQAEEAVMLNEFKIEPEKHYAIIFGNEVKGVGQEVVNQSDYVIEIPQSGTKHSLNIAVSAGIVLWDFYVNTVLKE